MNSNPEPKDQLMAIVTVSTVFLALTPVFMAIQPHQAVNHDTVIILNAFLLLSFVLGLLATATGVDWFGQPSASKKRNAKIFLIVQTTFFTFSSFILLFLNLFST